MCGVFGIVNFGNTPITNRKTMAKEQYIDLVERLLLLNEINGSDASGLLHIGQDWGKIRIFKRPYRASSVTKSVDYQEFVNEISPVSQVVLGHTRARTVGSESNNLNNHPVVYGSVAGVHNGSINNADWVFGDERLPRKAEVDTEALMALVDKYIDDLDVHTKKESVRKTLSGLGLIAALMVSSKKPHKLMVMVTTGSLHVGWLRDYQMAIFSTSAYHIKRAVKAVNATVDGKYTVIDTESIKNNKFFIWDVPSLVTKSHIMPYPRLDLDLIECRRNDPLEYFMGM